MPTFLDLFSGAGGMSLGLHAAGFSSLGAVENDAHASVTYSRNLAEMALEPSMECLGPERGDMRRLGAAELASRLADIDVGEGELDLLAAGPPCQGYSHVGRSKLDSLARQRGAFQHDPRNDLYLAVADLLPALRPRAFLVENVPGILNHGRVNVAERIAERAEAAGYVVRVSVLNAAWYGVPQTRERVFVLGFRDDLGIVPAFPAPEHRVDLSANHLAGSPWIGRLFQDQERVIVLPRFAGSLPTAISAREALGDLPVFVEHLVRGYRAASEAGREDVYREIPPSGWYGELMRSWPGFPACTKVRNHVARSTPRDHETFRRMRPGDRYPEALRIARARYEEARDGFAAGRNGGERSVEPSPGVYVPPYPETSFRDKWRKLIPEKPSWTVTAHLSKDGYSHIHYDGDQARTITPREAARLQSFPDSFVFPDSLAASFRQIGNAVPPLLARAIGRRIARDLAECASRPDEDAGLLENSSTIAYADF